VLVFAVGSGVDPHCRGSRPGTGHEGAAAPVFAAVGCVDRVSRAGGGHQENVTRDGPYPDPAPAGFLCGLEPAGLGPPVGADVELAADNDHAEFYLRAGLVPGCEAE
jgi:hypothetical protein